MSQQNDENFCSSPLKIIIVGTNRENKQAILFNPRCKKWDCEYCAKINSEEWIQVGMRGAFELASLDSELRFVTLTSRPYASATSSLYFYSENWPKLNARIKYHTEKNSAQKWAYFAIPERDRAGRLHVHLIGSTTLTTKWFKDNGHATGFGYMSDSQKIQHPAQTVAYITKYLSKQMQFAGWPENFRRIRTSRNWPKKQWEKPPGWEYSTHDNESAWFEYYYLKDAGYDVTDKRLTNAVQ